jgi:peptidoglycan/LPS O-acetylase OafA/YrhL
VSIGGGVLLSHIVERPFLRWRQRVQPSAENSPASVVDTSSSTGATVPGHPPITVTASDD